MTETPHQDLSIDPGWGPALRNFNPPSAIRHMLRPQRLRQAPGLTVIRSLYLSLFSAGLVIGYVLVFVVPIEFDFEWVPSLVIVAMGILGQILRRGAEAKSWDPTVTSSPDSFAGAYRTRFFLGFALTESTLMLGFVFCFIEDAIWPYLVALPFFLYGMLAIAPSKANLQRLQERLTAQGQMTSVIEALNQPTQAGRER